MGDYRNDVYDGEIHTVAPAGEKILALLHYCQGMPRCVNCGCEDFFKLSLDHIFGGGKEEREKYSFGSGGQKYYMSLRRRGYPDIPLQILCKRCNESKGRTNLTVLRPCLPFDYDNPIPDAFEQSLWNEAS